MATQQEIKDKLWRLNEDAEGFAADVLKRTTSAWKLAVEHGAWKRELPHARNAARALLERIERTMEDVGIA